MFFCATCYPVQIYQSFGCDVLDDVSWAAHPLDARLVGFAINEKIIAMAKVLAYLKSVPHDLKLFE